MSWREYVTWPDKLVQFRIDDDNWKRNLILGGVASFVVAGTVYGIYSSQRGDAEKQSSGQDVQTRGGAPLNIIVTGGHSGLGLELSKKLLSQGHKLGLIIRNPKRKDQVVEQLGQDLPVDKIDFFYADFSKQEEIVQAAKDISERWQGKVDGMFNNAGVLLDDAYYSDQGNELHFEINTLAPIILSTQLKKALDQSASGQPFIVNTVTGGVNSAQSVDVADLKKPVKFVKLLGSYKNSKVALTWLMNRLAGKWSNISIVNVDPGPNKTGMTAGSGMPWWLSPFRGLLFGDPAQGALKIYNGAFDGKFKDETGIYVTGGKVVPVENRFSDEEVKQIYACVKVELEE